MTEDIKSEPAYYILITSNLRTFERTIPAPEIVKELVDSGYWLLGSKTRNRKRIKPGDKALFYAAGQGNSVFLATATVTSMVQTLTREVKKAMPAEIIEELDFEYPELFSLKLSDITYFEKPVPARSMIEHLNFIKNQKRWGIYFQGGSTHIPEEDFETILSEGLKN